MSGAFPISSAKFESLGIKSIQNTIISKSVSGKKLARQIDNQRFAFTIRIVTGTRSNVYGELMAFIIKQRSGKENFTIVPPEIKNARGSANEVLTLNGAITSGATTFTLNNASVNSVNGFLKAGDYFRFTGQSKVYMIVENVNTNESGVVSTVTFEPPLISNVSDNTVIIYDNVDFTVHQTNDIQEFGVIGADNNGSALYQFEFDVEEAL
ncbi:MAG: hypothetical protein HKN40_12575 [Winogradskyella sp.]|uniref:hypothetical protein n=1 Tax=Winogradskyella sp. TaxID=1883156 RepID=UPI0017DA3555|nr:hypothetical protein [Winogradskyella sp.]